MTKKRNIDLEKYFMPDLKKARKRIADSQTIRDSFEIPTNIVDIGVGKTYFIRTYGCQSNLRDTETMKGILEVLGYTESEKIETADLIILNTCAIRENAENKVFGEIGYLKQFKLTNPSLMLGVSGCMSQEEVVVNKILREYEYVDFVLGTHNIYRLPQILEQALLAKDTVVEVWSKEGDIVENMPSVRDSHLKAWVNIMYGCDKFCTYCIVPYTRGKVRSRAKEDIIAEIEELIKNGYKEVTLLGQNVNSYGKDFSDSEYRFKDLLRDVAKTGMKRIRFTTSNPFDWDDEIIDVMSEYPNVMPFVHLPIQSGDEDILLKMNRKMKIEKYLETVRYLREKIPNVAISTDLIVGFPNETSEQFQHTLDLYNQVQFDNAYTFIYSPRSGTPAASFPDEISLKEKRQRLQKLNEMVRMYAKKNNEKFVGQTIEVLVEGPSKTNPNVLTGYSPQLKVVNFRGNANTGDMVMVKIISASRFSLNGEQISE